MATIERRRQDSTNSLHFEAGVIAWRLSERYSRAPERRKEQRLDMDIADTLQRRRDALVLEEFSSEWVKRAGALP